MADLKARSGFELIKNIDSSKEGNVKSAGCGDTCLDEEAEKGKCDSCDSDKDTLRILRGIIKYIEQFISTRFEEGEEVSYGAVVTHCRESAPTGLGFDGLERKLDHKKFKTVVENILKKHKNDPEESNMTYTSEADVASSFDDDVADYINHAQTG
jgi:hypothetical protein